MTSFTFTQLPAMGSGRRLRMLVAVMCCIQCDSLRAQAIILEEQQAIQQATANVNESIVRIDAVGGVDLVGKLLTGTGPTTGVVLREDGYMITSSFNFASKPASVLVTLPNEERFAAEIVATDHSKMLTLLKIEQSGLTPIRIAPKSQMRVGQRTIALGRTFDLEFPNISTGIISALNRIQGRAIQTDAKTSPVNYGGPLIDLHGHCLGIIVPLSSQGEGETAGVDLYDSGIGFAIPLEDIERVADRLIAGEDLHQGLLGVGFEDSGPIAATAKIARVRPRSPADQAGLEPGDVITQIDGLPIRRLNDLTQTLGSKYARDVVSLQIMRGDESFAREIELTDKLIAYQFPWMGFLPARPAIDEVPAGVNVRLVFENSPAAKAELKAGDLIVKFKDAPVRSLADLANQLNNASVGEAVDIEVSRDNQTQTLQITLEKLSAGSDLPNIPPVNRPPGQGSEETKVGRFHEQLLGSDNAFWVYVPQNYNPEFGYGLLVWLHPPGDTMEAELMRGWQDLATEHGMIIAAPRAADLSGFSEADLEFPKDVAEWIVENYTIDPLRIAVMGSGEGAAFATQTAFKHRSLFRGLLLIDSPLRLPPPDNYPSHRLLVAFVTSPETEQAEPIKKSTELLNEQGFPTALLKNDEPDLFAFDAVNTMVRWLEALDRL